MNWIWQHGKVCIWIEQTATPKFTILSVFLENKPLTGTEKNKINCIEWKTKNEYPSRQKKATFDSLEDALFMALYETRLLNHFFVDTSILAKQATSFPFFQESSLVQPVVQEATRGKGEDQQEKIEQEKIVGENIIEVKKKNNNKKESMEQEKEEGRSKKEESRKKQPEKKKRKLTHVKKKPKRKTEGDSDDDEEKEEEKIDQKEEQEEEEEDLPVVFGSREEAAKRQLVKITKFRRYGEGMKFEFCCTWLVHDPVKQKEEEEESWDKFCLLGQLDAFRTMLLELQWHKKFQLLIDKWEAEERIKIRERRERRERKQTKSGSKKKKKKSEESESEEEDQEQQNRDDLEEANRLLKHEFSMADL